MTNSHKNASVFVLLCLLISPVYAQDPLSERGIHPKILDVMVTDMSQNLKYTQQADITITTEKETFNDRALIVFNPFTEYGIDLYMKFDEEDPDTMAPRKFRKMLENRMKLQHQLRVMEFQYDPKTIEVESQDGDKAVIKFRYSKFALPQHVAWMRFLQGRVWVEGNRVKRMELSLDEGKSFYTDGMQVRELQMKADFIRVANGQDLLNNVENTIKAEYYGFKLFNWGDKFTISFNTKIQEYSAENGTVIYQMPADTPEFLKDSEKLTTVRVQLDNTFPLWGREIRKEGFDLPKAFGVSAMYNEMVIDMNFTSFTINGEQQAIEAIFDPNGSGITVDSVVPQVRADWFVLPFLNLMVIAGNAEATGRLKIKTTGIAQLIGLPPVIESDIKLDLTMAGVGATLAAGYKNFFTAMTGTYMKTVTEGADSESTAISFTPLFGYQFVDYRFRLLAGAEYLKFDNKMEGTIDLGGGKLLDFNIGVETESWAWRTGIHKELGTNWELVASYTWGEDRSGYTLLFGYRW